MRIDQELAGDGDQDDFGRLAGGEHALDEGGECLIGPFGAERTHVELTAQALGPDTAHSARLAYGGTEAVLLR